MVVRVLSVWVVVLLFVVRFWVFVCLLCLFRWWLEFECIAGSGGVLVAVSLV